MDNKVLFILFTLLTALMLGACGNNTVDSGGCITQTALADTSSTYVGSLIAINASCDSFQMGDDSYYGPQPNVPQIISYNFQMSKHEITNAQFQQFVDDGGYSNNSYWTGTGIIQRDAGKWMAPRFWTAAKRGTAGNLPNADFDDDNQPVAGVSWWEAVAYSNWLSVKEGLVPAYNNTGELINRSAGGYRLPTEVEWEYAATKGQPGVSERIYPWGDVWDCTYAVDSVSPCSSITTAEVGSTSPNGDTPQGLADMSGNVSEWISDNSIASDSVLPTTDWYYFTDDQFTTYFAFRGGPWDGNPATGFIGAGRLSYFPAARGYFMGFRVVRP